MSTLNRVALLTSYIAPYRTALFKDLERCCRELKIFVLQPVESSRGWSVDWKDLPVQQQRSVSVPGARSHPQGFREREPIHIPYDTIPQLMRFDPDVILSDEFGLRTLQAAAYRKTRSASRLVIWAKVSEVTEQGRGRLRSLLRRKLLRMADAVIVNGASGARYVRQFGAVQERVFRVPQTTDVGPFMAVPLARPSSARRRFLYCGQLTQRKGLVPFVSHLAAFARAHPNQALEMWFAGDGPLRAELAEFRRPDNLDFAFLGNVPYDRLPEVYGQAGILVFPTLADEWGLVVVEAMAAGLPVLGSLYSQAVEDLVTDGVNGWTFRPDHALDLRSALNRAVGAPVEEIDRMGRHARNRVRDLTPELMSRQMMTAMEYAYARHT